MTEMTPEGVIPSVVEAPQMSPELHSVFSEMTTIWGENTAESNLTSEEVYNLDKRALTVLKDYASKSDANLDNAIEQVKHIKVEDGGEGVTVGAIVMLDLLRDQKTQEVASPAPLAVMTESNVPSVEDTNNDKQEGSRFSGWRGLSKGQRKEKMTYFRDAMGRNPVRDAGPRALETPVAVVPEDTAINDPKPVEKPDESVTTQISETPESTPDNTVAASDELSQKALDAWKPAQDDMELSQKALDAWKPAQDAWAKLQTENTNTLSEAGAEARPLEEVITLWDPSNVESLSQQPIDLAEERAKRNLRPVAKKAIQAVAVAGIVAAIFTGKANAPTIEAATSTVATAPSEEVLATPQEKEDVLVRLEQLKEHKHVFQPGESFSEVTFKNAGGESNELFRTYYENAEHAAGLALANIDLLLENNQGMTRDALLEKITHSINGDEVASQDIVRMLDHVEPSQLGVILPAEQIDEMSKDLIKALQEGKFTDKQVIATQQDMTPDDGSLYTVIPDSTPTHDTVTTANAAVGVPDITPGGMPAGSDIAGIGAVGVGAAAAALGAEKRGLFSRFGKRVQSFRKKS